MTGRSVAGLISLALSIAIGWIGCCVAQTSSNISGDVTVRGATLLRDGHPWVPKGVTVVGRVAPATTVRGGYRAARLSFGADELLAARRIFDADTIRFQVSQPGLDPDAPIYSADYAGEVIDAVRLARSLRFTVIVSMQWQAPSGLANQQGMPSAATVRAWRTLCPTLVADPGVMLELFNEPREPATASGKERWHQGMQQIVRQLRTCDARNVLILDGLESGHVTDPLPLPEDAMHQQVLAVHPYLTPWLATPTDWDRAFGSRARQVATIATEWNGTATSGCIPNLPAAVKALLAYLNIHRIGLVAWAMDYPDTLFRGNGFTTLTTYRDFRSCQQATPVGASELFRAWQPR